MKVIANGILALAAAGSMIGEGVNGAMNAKGLAMRDMKEASWNKMREEGLLPMQLSSAMNQAQECTSGSVSINGEAFPCSNIDFEGFLALQDSVIPNFGGSTAAADIWGWPSPEGKEITLWCVNNGLWFIDTTDPANMEYLGYMVAGLGKTSWCDVKVYKDTAYVVKDVSSVQGTGIQVFDLNRLVGLTPDKTRSFEPDFDYHANGHTDSHNIAVDTESGFLYSVGTNTCSAGLHMLDLANPLEPTFAGCVSGDGYTHDVQCVVYDGPDSRFTGNQICFAFNEDTLTIWDVTEKSSPLMLSRKTYGTASYTHQGWITDNMKYVIMNDELDELDGEVSTTTTYFVNIQSLTNPVFETVFDHGTASIDHNLYVWGSVHKRGWGGNPPMENPPSLNFAYLSNYRSGIRVLDISQLPAVSEAGFFDVAPEGNSVSFAGTWSNYMHPSGVLAVSSIERGLFTLRPQMAFQEDSLPPTGAPVPSAAPVGPVPTPAPTPGTTLPPIPIDGVDLEVLAIILLGIGAVLLVIALLGCCASYKAAKKTVSEEMVVKAEDLNA